ncbi:MAG: hypothetical protein IPP90_15925 [Gemmatimonadaceae bacterium]|nr:hypothetical protein [Gemmatimonadaceae bacterium]
MVNETAADSGESKVTKGESKEMLDSATDLVRALVRGSAKGFGKGLKALGEELEKFGEQLKGSDR